MESTIVYWVCLRVYVGYLPAAPKKAQPYCTSCRDGLVDEGPFPHTISPRTMKQVSRESVSSQVPEPHPRNRGMTIAVYNAV